MRAPKKKPPAEKRRAWRASLMRSRSHFLGIVYAPDEKSAGRDGGVREKLAA
jgi:hypothetical protein